ncbi:hypothetical protein [Castellaniella sp.]|uniref:hypothetical protein n=1 Tax=Castellaniella sp. TaxID=1955812 RepID=UPI002AFF15BF|nr:hypothetical protein [Castellaniella sp.]
MTKDEAIQRLNEVFGATARKHKIFIITKKVSASGMSREMEIYVFDKKANDMRWITPVVASACGYKMTRDGDRMRVDGCGMNMHFAVAYDLSQTLGKKIEYQSL